MKNWYSIRAQSDGSLEVLIYDEIGGWGIYAADLINQIKDANPRSISLRINSPGGSVFDGVAIHNFLKSHSAEVTAIVDGYAASIASVIAMAGDKIIAPENTLMMIHNPHGVAFGESKEMRSTADLIDKIRDQIVDIYVNRSGQEVSAIQNMMDAETWMTGSEAAELGFVDEVGAPMQIAAAFDLSKLSKYKNTGGVMSTESGLQEEEKETAEEEETEEVEENSEEEATAQPETSEVSAIHVAEIEGENKALVAKVVELGEDVSKANDENKQLAEDIEQSLARVKDLSAEVASLKCKLANPAFDDTDGGRDEAVTDTGDTEINDVWSQYRNIEDSGARTQFYRDHRKELIKAGLS